MYKKLLIVGLSAILLGGCTLTDVFKNNQAAEDSKPISSMTPSPSPSAIDTELQAVPSTSTSSDVDSLETDINNTTILKEDFSDLN